MGFQHVLVLVFLLVPLALDTFILTAALSLAGLPKKDGVRTSLILASFEAVMPVVGVLIGCGLGSVIGHFAGYTAAVVIGLAGFLMLRPGQQEDKEAQRLKLLAHAKGLAIIDLGISIDELTIGLSLGLLRLPLIIAVLYLGIQAFGAAQLGFWLGGRLSEKLREGAEKLGGAILVVVAIALIALKLNATQRFRPAFVSGGHLYCSLT